MYAAILAHERERTRETEADTAEIRQAHYGIHAARRHIMRLVMLGEGVIGRDETNRSHCHAQRLHADNPHNRNRALNIQLNGLIGGLGLGLATVADMVKLPKGSINVESEPGKRSRFTVSLLSPKAEESMRGENKQESHVSLPGRNVLAIDHDFGFA